MPANFAIISCLQSITKLVAVNSQPINRKNKQLNRYNHIYFTYPPDFCLGFSTFLLSTFFAAVLFHCCPLTRECSAVWQYGAIKISCINCLRKMRAAKNLFPNRKKHLFSISLCTIIKLHV